MEVWITKDETGEVSIFTQEPVKSRDFAGAVIYTMGECGGEWIDRAKFPDILPGECRKAKIVLEGEVKIHETLANCHPKLQRGQVWCHKCGRTEKVNSADALQHGWTKCCGYTMSLDSPAERKELKKEDE